MLGKNTKMGAVTDADLMMDRWLVTRTIVRTHYASHSNTYLMFDVKLSVHKTDTLPFPFWFGHHTNNPHPVSE